MAALDFTIEGVEPMQNNFDPLPAGRYRLSITETDVKTNNSGNGEHMLVVCDVIGGETGVGRKHFQRYNIRNDNATAESIAKAELAALLAALGKTSISDTDELLGCEFEADMRVEPEKTKGDKTYAAQNRISAYHSVGGAVSAPAKQPTKAAPVQTGNNKSAPPWAKQAA